MGYQIKVLKTVISLLLVISFYVISIGQTLTIALEKNGDIIFNDSTLNAVFFDVDRISSIIEEDYKVCRLKRPNVRFYNFKFKESHTNFLSISYKEKIRFSRWFTIDFRKRKRKRFQGKFYFFGEELDWNTTFEEIYNEEKYKKFVDKSIEAYPDDPNKDLIHIYYSDYFMSLWFYKDKDIYKLEKIDFKIISQNFKEEGKKT